MVADADRERAMTSEIISISPQSDGRAYVTERHTDQFGAAHTVEYLADKNSDCDALLTEHAAQLTAQLRQSELDSWLTQVRDGQPIPVGGCRYVARNEAFAYCFRALVFDPDVQSFYHAAWMVPYFTDDEFTAMGFTSEQITDIRDRASTLAQAKALLDSVTPLEAA